MTSRRTSTGTVTNRPVTTPGPTALATDTQLLLDLFDTVPHVMVCVKDVDGVYVGVNRAFVRRTRRHHAGEVLGRRAGDDMVVLAGLRENESVVVAANFLIDAESNLRAALQTLQAEPEAGMDESMPAHAGEH